ncbi:hypothetical protein ACIBCM_12515 [Streptomyces sp. NPDC051018]|uniref:hypothetical protein n=1 Tax=Streptomyces sp. NPDC051018 TaxID=3365639 RepID=UPI0037BAD028
MSDAFHGGGLPGTGVQVRKGKWGTATEWFSVALACVAVVISVLSLRQSHDAERNSAAAARWEKAAKVGFYQQAALQPPQLHIRNHNSFSIREVSVTFADGRYLDVDLVPACSLWTLSGYSSPGEGGGTYTLPFPARLDFTDADDPPRRWVVRGDATLTVQKSEPRHLPEHDLTSIYDDRMSVESLGSCS